MSKESFVSVAIFEEHLRLEVKKETGLFAKYWVTSAEAGRRKWKVSEIYRVEGGETMSGKVVCSQSHYCRHSRVLWSLFIALLLRLHMEVAALRCIYRYIVFHHRTPP